jgi:hypothetical protein
MSKDFRQLPASDWLDLYLAGERERVWQAMLSWGPDIRGEDPVRSAEAVARETMNRVRANVETLVARLQELGYEFHHPDRVHIPPGANDLARLEEFERRVGTIPLSLRFFYEVVGTVDLTQSWEQLVQWHEPQRESASELQILGEYDPLVVGPLGDDAEKWADRPGWFYLAPDEFHKANYSGGENYHVALPDPRADFPIRGMYDVDEFFVPYLRATFSGGGFRGRIEGDEERSWKVMPDLEVTKILAAGLPEI